MKVRRLRSILDKAVKALVTRNWLAEYRLLKRSQTGKRVVCLGKLQISLGRDARLRVTGRSVLGVPIMGAMTPRTAVTVLQLEENSQLILGKALIGRSTVVRVGPRARLEIGDNTFINDGSRIDAGVEIRIGRDCAIAWNVTLLDDDRHGFGLPPYRAPIYIEDHVWIGCNVLILKGVTIGAGSVVAAGAVVTKSCPPSSLIGGVPARVLRRGVEWTDACHLADSQARGLEGPLDITKRLGEVAALPSLRPNHH
jgi:acetyltransferase-like isoleucine patch superfamily enzyme